MFAFVSAVTTVSNDPVSNDGSILVVIIKIIFIFSTPLSPLAKRGIELGDNVFYLIHIHSFG